MTHPSATTDAVATAAITTEKASKKKKKNKENKEREEGPKEPTRKKSTEKHNEIVTEPMPSVPGKLAPMAVEEKKNAITGTPFRSLFGNKENKAASTTSAPTLPPIVPKR